MTISVPVKKLEIEQPSGKKCLLKKYGEANVNLSRKNLSDQFNFLLQYGNKIRK